ncbi:MAG: GNAT family N-acetyltransferase [Desulfurococcales archaeon]|nr:GNAT family N-acetyltransferase [Desulfurococcales archaeon]
MCVLSPPQSRRGEGYVIRRAREEDLTQVMEVNYRSLPENYWYGFFKYILERWPEAFVVAEADGRVVGYAMSRVETVADPVLRGLANELGSEASPLGRGLKSLKSVLTQFRPRSPDVGRVGHLVSIAVLEEYRGRGIGSALLEETIRVMREVYDVESVYLEVRVSNDIAIRLYEKYGFVKARRVKGYYMDGEDAYIMVLRLKPLPVDS